MTGYLADTFYWIALINSRDQAHWPVIDFTRKLGLRAVITTDEVLGELLDYYGSHPQLRKTAGLTANNLLNHPDIRVVPQSRSSFQEGIALYNARPDKGYSLTDCISMVTMRREGLTEVLTNDHHFEQEGFRAIFRF